MSESTTTIRDLRRLWKPEKERLNAEHSGHSTNVRFHRACSWIQRAEEATDRDDLDLVLLSQWIAFNTLYGQWDEESQEPLADKMCWQHFVDRMLSLDEDNFIVDALMEKKPLVMSIYDDEFLTRYFWQEPTEKRAKQSKKTKYNARTWYLDGNWTLILDRLTERIYLLRCQLVHGAATFNSSLNRTATRRCSAMMEQLLKAFLLVWINRGAEEDWGIMCYPPMKSKMLVR